MMQLIRHTSLWGQGQYNGWIIPRAIYRRHGSQLLSSVHTQLLTERKQYAVLRTTGYTDSGKETQSLDVTLLSPPPVSADIYKGIRNDTALYNDTILCMADKPVHSTLFFTMEGLKRYLMESADTNPIHQGSPALVPGLWILNCLREHFLSSQDAAELDIRFTHPVYTDEPLLLYRERNTVKGMHGSFTCFKMNIKPININMTN